MFISQLKKPLIWIIGGVLLISGIIIIPPLFDVYVYHPKPEIKEEDYFILSDDPPTTLKPMPKEDLEVTIQKGKQIVDAKKDGYQLVLDPEFRVVTREIEAGRVMIYKGDCRAVVYRKDKTEKLSVPEWFERDKAFQELDFGSELKDYHLERIPDKNLTAYYSFMDTEVFGLEKMILIEGKNGIFSISQSNQNNDCFPIEEIYKGFQLK